MQAGDIHYNIDLMKQENQTKGCLIRNSGLVLCKEVGFEDQSVDRMNGHLLSKQWNSNENLALKEFTTMKRKIRM